MSQVTPNNLKQLTGRYLKYLPVLLALIIWFVLILKEQYYLRKVEDLSLFLFDRQFILDSFRNPGGFLGLVGAFLTQFLHIPWLGSLIWVALLLLAYHITVKSLSIPAAMAPLAMIPIALLVIGNMSLGYGVFIMREQDHFFSPVLGYMVSLIPLVATRRFNATWGKICILTVWAIAGFMVFGTYSLTGVLVAAFYTMMQNDSPGKVKIAMVISAIALVIIAPLVIYPAYTSYRLVDSWTAGLPTSSEDEWIRPVRTPFQLALLCQILLAWLSGLLSRMKSSDAKTLFIGCSAYIAVIAAVWGFWFKDELFHTELAMSHAVDNCDWGRTVSIFREAVKSHEKSDARTYAARTRKIASAHSDDEIADIVDKYKNRFYEPTRTMILYRDLALLKTNRALDESFSMKNGSRLQKSRTQLSMALQSGKQLYLHYGLVNMCYRWCLEDAVEQGWSNSTIKYITMHAMTIGDYSLARKSINKLEKTLFYRKWADSQLALLSDTASISSNEPYKSILPYMCFEDMMSNDLMKSETFIINHFLGPQPSAATPEYDRAALLFAMHIQDIRRFWERLLYYVDSNDFKSLPRSVQEAAILYSSLEKRNNPLPLDDRIKESYDAFNRYVQSHPIRSMKESDYTYCQKYGKTFYYFYYFVRDLQTY